MSHVVWQLAPSGELVFLSHIAEGPRRWRQWWTDDDEQALEFPDIVGALFVAAVVGGEVTEA